MEFVKEKPVSLPEALALLTKRQKEGELSYEQQNTLAYLQAMSKVGEEDAKELEKELAELGLSDAQAVALIDVMPSKEEDVKLILSQKPGFPAEKVKDVAKALKKYKKGKTA